MSATQTATRSGAATMDQQQTNQGLAQRTPSVITTPDQYMKALEAWGGQYNILTPFTNAIGIAPSFGLIASVVKIRLEPEAGEVYSGWTVNARGDVKKGMPFLKGEYGKASEEFAPAKIGLRKLAENGGISTDAVRTDGRTIPYYWEFKATASYRGLDGSIITRSATFEWDLRDGSDRLKGWTADQITEGRKNGLRNCESRAINAAIRECGCGILQKYTRAQLEKPFLVIRVAFQPDMADPDIKRFVTEKAMGGVNALYPHGASMSAPALAGGHDDDQVAEPRHVGSSSTQPAASSAAAPKQDLPPVEGAVKIASAEGKPGEKNGRKYTRYVITDSNGQAFSTFDKQHFDDATRFKASGDWVEIVTETNGQYTNIIEIIKAGTEPPLPGMEKL